MLPYLTFSSQIYFQVYRRGMDEDGTTTDSMKAFHFIDGITAHELCGYFYDPKLKMEWERRFWVFHTSLAQRQNTVSPLFQFSFFCMLLFLLSCRHGGEIFCGGLD